MDLTEFASVLGRVLLGGYFAFNGVMHLLQIDALTGYVASKKIPHPRVAVLISVPFLLFGGLGVLLGVGVTWALYLLIIFMVPVTFLMHAFWKVTDPNERTVNRVQFLKNLALLGGLLMLLSIPTPWSFSLL